MLSTSANVTLFLPFCFEEYMALSHISKSSSIFVVCSKKLETPKEAVIPSLRPSMGSFSIAALIRSAAIMPPFASIPGRIMKNSSPP